MKVHHEKSGYGLLFFIIFIILVFEISPSPAQDTPQNAIMNGANSAAEQINKAGAATKTEYNQIGRGCHMEFQRFLRCHTRQGSNVYF